MFPYGASERSERAKRSGRFARVGGGTAPGTAKLLEITARTPLGSTYPLEIPCSNPTGVAQQPLSCDLARQWCTTWNNIE